MSYEKKQAIVRFEVGKARLDQILEPYKGTSYTVTPASPLATVFRVKHLTIRTWADPAVLSEAAADGAESQPPANIYVEFVPDDGVKFSTGPTLTVQDLSKLGLTRVRDVVEIDAKDAKPPLAPGARRMSLSLGPTRAIPAGPLSLPFNYQCTLMMPDGEEYSAKGEVQVALEAVAGPNQQSQTHNSGVALIGGSLDIALGHLCDQERCVDSLHKALGTASGLVGVRVLPSLSEPRVVAFTQADQSIDVSNLRGKLRQQGFETRQLIPRDFRRFELQVDLRRWHDADTADSVRICRRCQEIALDAVRSLAWTSEAIATERGLTIRTRDVNADICIPLDRLEEAGIAPISVWLVSQGGSAPNPAPPIVRITAEPPRKLGSDAHPLIQFEMRHDEADHDNGDRDHWMNALSEQVWASRTGMPSIELGAINPQRMLPGIGAVAALGDRQRADLVPLLHRLQSTGRQPTGVRLTEFGDLRVQLEFAHICGEIEYSKPPNKKANSESEQKKAEGDKDATQGDAKNTEGATNDGKPAGNSGGSQKEAGGDSSNDQKTDADKPAKSEEKPFVPLPLRPAPSSNSRQAIERAIATVKWVEQGTYLDYHTKPEFDGPRTLTVTLRPRGDGIVALDELTHAVTRAGFPPTAVRVSRLFPGIQFEHAVPPDLELQTIDGENRLLSSYRQSGRPLAVAFVSLYCPNWDKYVYQVDPKYFAKFKQLVDSYKDRVDFVAVSSNPDDKVVEVAECLKTADVEIPLLNDPDERARMVFNAQITPPPHIFVFDAEGQLRYAGDPYSGWIKPDEEQKDFLGPAIDLVISRKFADNGAVSFNSPKCNCSSPNCKCPKCGCGPTCRCEIGHCRVGF